MTKGNKSKKLNKYNIKKGGVGTISRKTRKSHMVKTGSLSLPKRPPPLIIPNNKIIIEENYKPVNIKHTIIPKQYLKNFEDQIRKNEKNVFPITDKEKKRAELVDQLRIKQQTINNKQ